ncbi:DUF2141 domain-containing protein [Terrimonas sp. NA20]|uniref:DUF2141 domain-containing protein n=1 Tax=Terrimonas ginsenosidimutans TaxID=2908004 RepID=A0ABS9KZT1_9BACT|nr:DUF2141 domain-containing protein [Terrimonas ginsenosidimutans]MCG2617821.1 DUF2141 domain-containing protein [Terrimonas ginsenosidimutans]
MKKLFTLLIFLPLISFRSAETKFVLTVSNLEKIKGKLYIGWYRSADDFRKSDKAVYQRIVEVDGKEAVDIPFENISPGTYAVAIFLDKNDNGKMDTNMLGIPKEKYGFSNNKYPLTRAATFKESAFEVGGNEHSITIKLKG